MVRTLTVASSAIGFEPPSRSSRLPPPPKMAANCAIRATIMIAAAMVAGFGGVMTRLTDAQASYIGVKVEGPFKPETYKY